MSEAKRRANRLVDEALCGFTSKARQEIAGEFEYAAELRLKVLDLEAQLAEAHKANEATDLRRLAVVSEAREAQGELREAEQRLADLHTQWEAEANDASSLRAAVDGLEQDYESSQRELAEAEQRAAMGESLREAVHSASGFKKEDWAWWRGVAQYAADRGHKELERTANAIAAAVHEGEGASDARTA